MPKPARMALFTVPAACLLIVLIAMLPPVRTRLELWSAEIRYALNPPEEVVFVPQEGLNPVDLSVTQTLQALRSSPTASPLPLTETPVPSGPTTVPSATPTPTMTPTPLPAAAQIAGVDYQTQRGLWNYCGPANLAMAVSFWGEKVLREEVGTYLRGGTPKDRVDDKNVMPYEMNNYVIEETNLRMVVRMGGTTKVLKALIAAGFPVVVEKEDRLQDIGWLGHYVLLIGYDDAAGEFTTMDTYHGEGTKYEYAFLEDNWRSFNYLFWVVYPPEQEAAVFSALGPYVDTEWATRRALERSLAETGTQTGQALFFAWFNLGTSYVNLFDYGPASVAFDTAFAVYAGLPKEDRPWRMMWYQTGPYFAYYYTGRYLDVLDLANKTLDAMNKPILEESFYWRGLAKEALGDIDGAVADLYTSVTLNPNFGPGWEQLVRLQP